MRISIHIILLLTCFLSCTNLGNNNRKARKTPVSIHLQSGFGGEEISIKIDDKPVFHARNIFEDAIIGHTATINAELVKGKHTIAVSIYNRYFATKNFDLKKELFIGIKYYRRENNTIKIIFNDRPFRYI